MVGRVRRRFLVTRWFGRIEKKERGSVGGKNVDLLGRG